MNKMKVRVPTKRSLSAFATYLLLSVGGLAMLFPFFWMISTSVKPRGTWYTLSLLPESITVEHYRAVLAAPLLPRWYLNTILIAVLGTLSVALFSSLAGYGFGKHKFPGREAMFTILLTTIMIPSEMTIIPWYVFIAKLGWVDTYQAIMAPGLVTTFGIFVMRQFMAGIPHDLIDAGRIDGVSELGLFWRICLPLAKPALAVVCIFTFLGRWNSFLWPLIVINSIEMNTLQVALARGTDLTGDSSALYTLEPDWGPLLAGATLAAIPMLVIFSFFQQQIVRGVSMSGIKG